MNLFKIRKVYTLLFKKFPGSAEYWEDRYSSNLTSGEGSYGNFAEFKSRILNNFVQEKKISQIIELGCGDGEQLKYAIYPKYIGFDVSDTVLNLCKKLFANDLSKEFHNIKNFKNDDDYDCIISLDVIYHLVEDNVFNDYMHKLFTSNKYVIIYSTNYNSIFYFGHHVRHRRFTNWVEQYYPDFELIKVINNEIKANKANFYFYQKK